MDVEHAPGETAHQRLAQDAHVAGADHPVRLRCRDRLAKCGIERGTVGEIARAGAPATRRLDLLQGWRLRAIGKHADHLGMQTPTGDRIDNGLQIAATAGGQYGQA